MAIADLSIREWQPKGRSGMRTPICILASLVMGSATALDLAGFTIGEQLTMMNRADLTRGGNGFCTETTCEGPAMLGDYSAKVAVSAAADGRIVSVLVIMPMTQHEVLVKAATEKFGKPTAKSATTVQNLFGARFGQVSLGWVLPDGNVFLAERCMKVDQACIGAVAKDYQGPDAGKKMKL